MINDECLHIKRVRYKNEDIIITVAYSIFKKEDCERIKQSCGDEDIVVPNSLKRVGFSNFLTHYSGTGNLTYEFIAPCYNNKYDVKIGKVFAYKDFISVLKLSDVKHYRPDFDEKDKKIIGEAVIIKNFTGSIDFELNGKKIDNIIGYGSVNFYLNIFNEDEKTLGLENIMITTRYLSPETLFNNKDFMLDFCFCCENTTSLLSGNKPEYPLCASANWDITSEKCLRHKAYLKIMDYIGEFNQNVNDTIQAEVHKR